MVITKIEAGKYSIVTAGGMKFTVEKRRSHYWVVKGNGLGAVQATLKECKEWAEKQTEKPAEPVTPDTVTKADEPKSNIDKVMLDFVCGNVIFNTPTQEVYDLLIKELTKYEFRWRSGGVIDANSSNRWIMKKMNSCFIFHGEPINGIGYDSKEFYERNYPSIQIVTLTAADFDKPKKEFTKDDLKTGMVVECRNGDRYMVIEGNYECECGINVDLMLIAEGNEWMDGNRYRDDLVNGKDNCFSIDKVYKRKMQGLGYMLNDISDRDLIWQRKPEYDWSRAETDMPMLVRNVYTKRWMQRYFAEYKNGKVFAWQDGCTSWTADGKITGWDDALPYKGNEHLVEGEYK